MTYYGESRIVSRAYGFRERLRMAWLVLIGRADAIVWPHVGSEES